MTLAHYTVRKARPNTPKDKAWVVLDATGRIVAGLGRMDERTAQAEAERLNAEEEVTAA